MLAWVSNIFLPVHNLGVGKKMNVGQEGPMYTHSDFRTSTCAHARTAAKKIKRASVHDPITQATDRLQTPLAE